MKLENVKIKDLVFPDYNPRKKLKPEDSEYKKIKNSIINFGYVDPIIINSDNTVVGGNQRATILNDLGRKEIECIRINIDKNKEKALNIALNKLSGDWDFEKLTKLLEDVKALNEKDFDLTGFDINELDKLMNEFDVEIGNDSSSTADDNFNVNESLKEIVEPVTQYGDIYRLGNHILMCGDSFNEQDRNKLLAPHIDMIFTDPPYDMQQIGGQGCFAESTKKIKKRIDKLVNFDVMKLEFMSFLDIPSFYIFTSKEGIKKYFKIFDDYNYNILVWGKTNAIPFNSNSFTPDLEYLLYFYSTKIKRIWNNSLKPADIYKKYYISSIQHAKKEDGDLHPTMKPLELINNRIKISSNKNGNVLDLFGGSGSTLIACEQTGRKCLMMEIDQVYCDIIIKRYVKYKDNSTSDVFLLKDNKKIPWNEISEYRPARKNS